MSSNMIAGLTAMVWCLFGVLWIGVVVGIIVYEVIDYCKWKAFDNAGKRR